jgi:hypothetical protein
MGTQFASVLRELFDYYGDFERESPAAAMIRAAGEKTRVAAQGIPLSDDRLEDVAAAGDTHRKSAIFPKQDE